MPRGNTKSLDSSSHIQRVTLTKPRKSISATHKVHIGRECVRARVHVCVVICALASGTRLTPESRGADRDRPIRINYSGHTQGASGTLHTHSQDNEGARTHTRKHTQTHTPLTFRMNVSCVILSMTRRTCDGRLPLIARYKQTQAVWSDVVVASSTAVFFNDGVGALMRVTPR